MSIHLTPAEVKMLLDLIGVAMDLAHEPAEVALLDSLYGKLLSPFADMKANAELAILR